MPRSAPLVSLSLSLLTIFAPGCRSTATASPSLPAPPEQQVAPGTPLATQAPATPTPLPSDPVGKANAASSINAFGLDFYAQTTALGETGNLVFSPTSISLAFGMAFGGSDGETAEELARAFHFPPEPRGDTGTIHHGFSGLLEHWDTVDRVELTIANRLYGERSRAFNPDYIELTDSAYRAPMVGVDFHGDPDGSRRTINGWVEEQTRDRIANLLPEGSITDQTGLVLVNAVYFNAGWRQPFWASKTRPQAFHSPGGDVEAQMMRKTFRLYAHAEDPAAGVDLVALPYMDRRMAMVIVRPTALDGLAAVEAGLNEATLARWFESLEDPDAHRTVYVEMPKFELSPPAISLQRTLNAMGVHRAFESHLAEFPGILSDAPSMFIDRAYHQTFIAVDERGTEAAAATAINAVPTSVPRDPAQFIVDRPFLFFVRDNHTGAVLFMGRVVDPTA